MVERTQAVYRWTLTMPPSLNHAYVNNPRGGRFTRKPVAEWKAEARDTIAITSIGLKLPSEPLAVHIRLYPPGKGKARFDTDNRIKLVLDALVASGVLDDDSHQRVPHISATTMAADGASRVEIAVETAASWVKRVDWAGLWQ